MTNRCQTCDREGCPAMRPADHIEGPRTECPRCVAVDDCNAHRVDWRARALDAETWRATYSATYAATSGATDRATAAVEEAIRAATAPAGDAK
jgi:hypothetical protein